MAGRRDLGSLQQRDGEDRQLSKKGGKDGQEIGWLERYVSYFTV